MNQPNQKPYSSNTSHLLALLFISFLLHLAIQVTADSHYNRTDNIALDCGSMGGDYFGRIWFGDISYSPIEKPKTSFTSDAKSLPTTQVVPYSNARVSTSEFTYSFPVTAGPKFIRLYFYFSDYKNFARADAFFDVKLSGNLTLLNNFSAASTASSLQTEGFTREFCVFVENSPSLNLTFTPSTSHRNSYAFVNGIEVISMPDELYFKPVIDTNISLEGIRFIGQNNLYSYSNILLLELVRRLNVCGSNVAAAGDTGMYRLWEDDLDYVSSHNKGVCLVNNSIALNYEKIPKYTAPNDVYRTARSMGENKTTNYSYNLTWSFVVDSGFSYLVRLHFCEFQVEIVEKSDRVFKIYIDKQVAEDYASIIAWSSGNGIPIYRDYVVFVSHPGKKTSNLDIALHPHPESTTYSDAILNGIEIFKIIPSLPTYNTTNGGLHGKAIVGIVGGSIFSFAAVLVLYLIVDKREEKRTKSRSSDYTSLWRSFSNVTTRSTKNHASALPSNLCRHLLLMELKTATNNFDDAFKIGVGGFGKVYKGYIDGGSIPVAIKRLDPDSQQGVHEFMTEIEMLSQLRQPHLVSLVGYCDEQGEMILVYDYMANGTLRDHLYSTTNPPLPWKERLRICIGAARGLHYLHTGAMYTIIHRDMKTTNILLDENWVAKVSDFGLSRVGPTTASITHVSTAVKGTFGYLDPEYIHSEHLTEKSDVYSFGVVLFEVLCARPAVDKKAEKKEISLALWAKSCCRKGTIDHIIDPYLVGKIAPECLRKSCHIALSCIKDEGSKRPSMNDVVRGLEFVLQLQETVEQGGNNEDDIVAANMIHDKDSTYLFSAESEEVFSSSDAKSVGNPMTISSGSMGEKSFTVYDSSK